MEPTSDAPRGPRRIPRRIHRGYLLAVALVSAAVAIVVPMCPRHDAVGRPVWRVQTVHDGDTVSCLDTEGRRQKIRLVGIDAPELAQPFGDESRQALVSKLSGGLVRVEGEARDQYGRLLALLWINDRDINREMVADGWAWAFGGFAADENLVVLESAARRERRGLWQGDDPLPPREWRTLHPPYAPSRR
jgi:endonuclease YncB( thermonuclease family)